MMKLSLSPVNLSKSLHKTHFFARSNIYIGENSLPGGFPLISTGFLPSPLQFPLPSTYVGEWSPSLILPQEPLNERLVFIIHRIARRLFAWWFFLAEFGWELWWIAFLAQWELLATKFDHQDSTNILLLPLIGVVRLMIQSQVQLPLC